MRIIGGKHKRRRFDVPSSFNARPTTDFAKENLFNVLVQYIDFEDCRCLDLFAGTGGISAEMISRGAQSVLSVEQRREHAQFIQSVVKTLHEEEAWHIQQGDVFRLLKAGGQGLYDFIFADPPYKLSEIADLPELILSSGHLAPEGLLVLEHPKQYDFSTHPRLIDHREYGSVNFSFFR
jgi:RNA methyltransferase, rsmD family